MSALVHMPSKPHAMSARTFEEWPLVLFQSLCNSLPYCAWQGAALALEVDKGDVHPEQRGAGRRTQRAPDTQPAAPRAAALGRSCALVDSHAPPKAPRRPGRKMSGKKARLQRDHALVIISVLLLHIWKLYCNA